MTLEEGVAKATEASKKSLELVDLLKNTLAEKEKELEDLQVRIFLFLIFILFVK